MSGGNKNALTRKLDNALDKYCDGKITPALNKLNAFISQVASLLADGKLTQAEADYLTNAAQTIIDAINDPNTTIDCPAENRATKQNKLSLQTEILNLKVFPNPTSSYFRIQYNCLKAVS